MNNAAIFKIKTLYPNLSQNNPTNSIKITAII